jgi:hypothetical protein
VVRKLGVCLRRLAVASILACASTAVTAGPASALVVPAAIGPVAAEQLTATSVTLVDVVDPNGSDTTYVFDYGSTAAYGYSTSRQDVGSGTSPVTVSVTLTGLSPDTLYHVDLVATNAAGSVSSADSSFMTPADQPTVTTPTGTGTRPGPTATSTERLARVPVANPAGWFDWLSAVSCASRSLCFAVGFAGRGRGLVKPIVERWTGHSFTLDSSPATPAAALGAIACAGDTSRA